MALPVDRVGCCSRSGAVNVTNRVAVIPALTVPTDANDVVAGGSVGSAIEQPVELWVASNASPGWKRDGDRDMGRRSDTGARDSPPYRSASTKPVPVDRQVPLRMRGERQGRRLVLPALLAETIAKAAARAAPAARRVAIESRNEL